MKLCRTTDSIDFIVFPVGTLGTAPSLWAVGETNSRMAVAACLNCVLILVTALTETKA